MKKIEKKCAACAEMLQEHRRVEGFWKKTDQRESFCLACFGEIFFDIIPKRTSTGLTSLAAARRSSMPKAFTLSAREGQGHHENKRSLY